MTKLIYKLRLLNRETKVRYFRDDDSMLSSSSTLPSKMPISFIDRSFRYGFQAIKELSLVSTVNEVIKNDLWSAMQFFISNPRSKRRLHLDYKELAETREILLRNSYLYVVVHGSLLYNLAGSIKGENDDAFQEALNSTLESLISELDYCVALDRKIGVIVHPGSYKDRDRGHALVSKNITEILTRETEESNLIAKKLSITPKEARSRRRVILENSAGEGTKLCTTLEEISIVIRGVPIELRSQIGVCIDTAHAFGAGLYDWGISGETERFYSDFNYTVGLEFLEVFHLNDSCRSPKDKRSDAPFGSKKDRHANLGQGYIFGNEERLLQIKTFMLEALKHKIPVLGEPPTSPVKDIELVCRLLRDTDFPLLMDFE